MPSPSTWRPAAPTTPSRAAARKTLRQVDRILVSDLSLGKGTSRTSFLERITKVSVFARTPGPMLAGAVQRRPAAPMTPLAGKCKDSRDVAVYVTPKQPHPGEPTRVVVTAERDLGAAGIELTGPNGQRLRPATARLGGPPFGYVATLDAAAPGRWQARVGDGDRHEACWNFTVGERGAYRRRGGGAVWSPAKSWNRATENFFSTWVEQLFNYAPDDDRTWTSLQQVLKERDKNLLYNHLGQNEDERLKLRPDCADLPYFLRAYFAWKMRLPFGYRHCSRGGKGRAPHCDSNLYHHLNERETRDEVDAFHLFVRTQRRRRRAFRAAAAPVPSRSTRTTTRCRSPARRCAPAPCSPIPTATCW